MVLHCNECGKQLAWTGPSEVPQPLFCSRCAPRYITEVEGTSTHRPYGSLTLREMGDLPAHLPAKGGILIGGVEFPYPIVDRSISVRPHKNHPFNEVTLTILVGEVTMDVREKRIKIPPHGPYTPEQLAEIERWFDSTELCDHCCTRVPKAEVEQGLHKHPAVMD